MFKENQGFLGSCNKKRQQLPLGSVAGWNLVMYRKGLEGNAVQITAVLMGPRNSLWASAASCLHPHAQPRPVLGLDRFQIHRKAREQVKGHEQCLEIPRIQRKGGCGTPAGFHLTSRVLYRTLKGTCWVLSGMVSCNLLLPASCLTVAGSPSQPPVSLHPSLYTLPPLPGSLSL